MRDMVQCFAQGGVEKLGKVSTTKKKNGLTEENTSKSPWGQAQKDTSSCVF